MESKCEYVDAIVRVRIPKYQLTAGENVSVCFPDATSVHGKIEEVSKKEE
jgi:hypothetical protein